MLTSPSRLFDPVIKWSGSKRYVAYELGKYIERGNRYIEPFIGGGSMLPFRKIEKAIAGDIIPELIRLWCRIKDDPNLVYNEYKVRWDKYRDIGESFYYEVRDNFNKTKSEFDFLFLTRTCINGMIRYNFNGEFNSSVHKNRSGVNPDKFKKTLLNWSPYLRGVEFFHRDYREVLSDVSNGDIIFLDPPYAGTKDRYLKTEFKLDDFYNELERLNSVGAKWILTFDGSAGEREYSYEIPLDLYKRRSEIKTGHSPFTKLTKKSLDIITESVYLNY